MKYQLPSGASLSVTPLAFEESWEVTQTIIDIAKALDIDVSGIETLEDIGAQEILRFKNPLCTLLASKEAVAAAKRCLEKSTYNGVRIESSVWESEKARGDFVLAAVYALKDNIFPFFGSLISFLKTIKK
jgi:hypothetical protein